VPVNPPSVKQSPDCNSVKLCSICWHVNLENRTLNQTQNIQRTPLGIYFPVFTKLFRFRIKIRL